MKKTVIALTSLLATLMGSLATAAPDRPTIVLVHGAFADASSWNSVINILESDGYAVVAVANPLRSVQGDAQYVADIVESINSPVVLVGHSYGGLSSEPAWKTIPAWFVYGDKDKNIPPQALAFMAKRAHSRKTVVIAGASHVVMVSHPQEVVGVIESAATAEIPAATH